MMRWLHRLRYFGCAALRGLRASPVTSAVAVATIGITLLLGGIFALLLGNMEDLVERFEDHLHLTVYLEEGIEASEQEALRQAAETIEGVEAATLISKEQALARFQAGAGRSLGLGDVLDENPFPASLELTLRASARSAQGVHIVVSALDGFPGVAEIGEGQEWLAGYTRTLSLARGVAFVFGAVLALATLLIVANTIRLAVYARRDEIEIQLLVGASRTFVAIPFLAEGFVQGLLGGMMALGGLLALYTVVVPSHGEGIQFLLGYAAPRFLDGGELTWLLASGALLGGLGSGAALVQGWRR